MATLPSDRVFAGSVPELYDTLLVPMIFEQYARDLARRAAARAPASVLEIAAGTGVVTRCLAGLLPAASALVATDLNAPMLARASATGIARPVTWQVADAQELPHADGSFDAVVCQFGVMFFPDRARAFSEARRVLRPGGALLFNVWDRLAANEFADTVTQALAGHFEADPPQFMARTPHGYFDQAQIAADLRAGGFVRPAAFTAVDGLSRAASAQLAATAYCQGTPLRAEIERREPAGLQRATDACAAALAARFGPAAISGRIRAIVVEVAA